MSWGYREGQLLYEDDLVEIVLKKAKTAEKVEDKNDIKPNDFKNYDLNPYFLWEWKTYRIQIKAKSGSQVSPEKIKIFFGDDEAEYDPDGNFWEYKFKNYIGKSEVKIYLEDRLLPPLQIEITSSKLSLEKEDKLFYPEFCKALIESLERHQLTLPIEIVSPTFIFAEDVPVPPNMLILCHQILEVRETVLEGINTILMDPHRDLTTTEEHVALYEVDTVNPEVCLSVIQNPHMLLKSNLSHIPLCSKLKQHLPKEILQYKNIETFDNPENRFVKKFLKDLLNNLTQIIEIYKDKLGEKLKALTELMKSLETALRSGCLQTASEFNPASIFTSQVLLKKEGYRELLQAYNKLLLSKMPLFTYLQEKINQRNIAEMYEFWCFFELSKKLADFFRIKPENFKVKVETTLEGGLAQNKVKSVIGDYELIYNKKFTKSKQGSYSIPLKPDFSLQKNEKALVAFDSKFRFDIEDKELEEIPVEESEEVAIQNIKIERIANIADIFKMHTYKDALNLKSAIILYPGNKNIFYSKYAYQKTEGSFEEIFEKICHFEEGIGCLSFIPCNYK